MTNPLKTLWQDEEGQNLTEYALILVLISLVVVTAMSQLGSEIIDVFSNAAENMMSAIT